jgi:hypothetical protein
MYKLKGKFEKVNGKLYFRMARPVIGVDKSGKPMRPHRAEKWCDSWLVTYPTGYRYNGGIVVNGKWCHGFVIASPKLPKGYKLTSIASGLQLNAVPPYATQYLEKIGD